MTLADLNQDALAELEAKLARDLEMVRAVRALLAEHQNGTSPAAAPAPPEAAQAPAPVPVPPPPHPSRYPTRPIDEILLDALATLPREGFFIEDLKEAGKKVSGGYSPDSDSVKAFLRQGARKGLVVVADIRPGRRGSLYTHTLTRPESPDAPPDSPETPAG